MPDRLLYSISTRGKMNFSNFYTAFHTIYSQVYKKIPEDAYLKFQTLRFLDALGHCDVDFERRYIYACMPTFVLVPSFGLPKVLLLGARTPDLIIDIKEFAAENKNSIRFYAIPQKIKQSLLPPAIYVEVADRKLLEGVSGKAGVHLRIDEPAAWCLINFSADVSEIKKNLAFSLMEEPDWPKRTFSIRHVAFIKYFSERADIRLVEYTNPRDQQKLHWLWHGDKAAEVDRDWGRFLSLHEQNVNVLLYDVKRFLLAVPSSISLPRLISRSLTLCTGLAPSDASLKDAPIRALPKDCHLNIYEAVVPQIAEVVSRKLGQELINYNLKVGENGVVL